VRRGRIFPFLRALTGRRRFEESMAEELRFHVDAYVDDLVRSGLPREEATRRARLEFGSVDAVKNDCRQARGLQPFDELQHSIRYALRLMRRSPSFTITALATIAICLGANLAIFAVVDGVLLRPLPFPAADRLVRVFNTYPQAGVPDDGVSLTNYYERRGRIPAFSSLAIYKEGTAIVGEVGATERERVTRVSPEFFATLGVAPARGRAFIESETSLRAENVAIVSDGYWRRVLGGDRTIIGRTLRVDGAAKTIVGVLPPDFSFLSSTARIFLPLSSDPARRTPDKRHWGSQADMVARLAPGVTLAEAQAQVDAHNAAMEAGGADAAMMAAAGFRSMVVGLRADHVAAVRPTLLLVQAGALFLLLMGGVNLVNLLLVRAAGRFREFAVRQAIGASRRHVVTEVVAETVLLALAGGALGLLAGAAGVRLLAWLGTDRLPLGARVAVDGRVAAAAFTGAILLGVLVAIPIAWAHLRAQSSSALHVQSRGATAGRATQRLRHGFLVAQIALAFVLLAGAGMLAVSLDQVMAVSPGFRSDHVLSGRVSLPWNAYQTGASRLRFTERLLDVLRRQPGVRTAAVTTNVPLSGNDGRSAATVEGRPMRTGEAPHAIYSYGVEGAYFAAMGVPVRQGRLFAADEARRSLRVCIVDEDFARRNWPDGTALGRQLWMGGQEGPAAERFTIVGVVGAVKQSALTEEGAQGAVFYPYPYFDNGDLYVVVRTSRAAESFGGILQRATRDIDPEVPVADVRSMDGRIADSLAVRRSPALLSIVFSAIALLLTAIGTYGILSYAVARRRREIGLRVALGARPGQVRRQFVSIALKLLAPGLLCGTAGAWMSGRAMQAVLFRVPPFHAPVMAGAAIVLLVVCLAACLLPAHRAARILPSEALADE
jgi:predicted permease